MTEKFNPYTEWFHIPVENQPPNYYQLLGIEEFESDLSVIEAAIVARAMILKPRKNGPHMPECRRLAVELTAARTCLMNPNRKSAYDHGLRQKAAKGESAEVKREETSVPADLLLKLLRQRRLLPASLCEQWAARVADSPRGVDATELAKMLVDQHLMTFGMAKRLLAKAKEVVAQAASSEFAMELDDAAPSESLTAPGTPSIGPATVGTHPALAESLEKSAPLDLLDDLDDDLELADLDEEKPKRGPYGLRETTEESSTSAKKSETSIKSTDGKRTKTTAPEEKARPSLFDEELAPLDEDILLGHAGAPGSPIGQAPAYPRRRGLAGWFAGLVKRRTLEDRLAADRSVFGSPVYLIIAVMSVVVTVLFVFAIIAITRGSRDTAFQNVKAAYMSRQDDTSVDLLESFTRAYPNHRSIGQARMMLEVATLRKHQGQLELRTPATLTDHLTLADSITQTFERIATNPDFPTVKQDFHDLALETAESVAKIGGKSSDRKWIARVESMLRICTQTNPGIEQSHRIEMLRELLLEAKLPQ